MKIVMITGSAHRHGTSAALADKFQQGGYRCRASGLPLRRGVSECAPLHRLRQMSSHGRMFL